MTRDEEVEEVASEFASRLAERIGRANMAKVVEGNLTCGDNVCTSHDYCDANVYMLEAFTAVTGRDPFSNEPDKAKFDDEFEIINEAWTAARPKFANHV